MMIEKRFALDYDGFTIKDNLVNRKYRTLNESCEIMNDLHERNRTLEYIIIDILDFIKDNDGVSREEMAKWWNNRVMNDAG